MRADSSSAVLSNHATVVFAGAFGSGKTEVAISYALAARAAGRAVSIVDLDVVTPYFRVGDYREQLERAGLRVVAPAGSLTSFELPAVPPEVAGVLRDRGRHVVLDGGGDPEGARLLAVYAELIAGRGYDLWVVVNPFRPSTSSVEEVAAQAREIEAHSQLQLTGLVANPNLGARTEMGDVQRGLELVQQAAARLRLPLPFLSLTRPLASRRPFPEVPVLSMDLALRLPWEQRSE